MTMLLPVNDKLIMRRPQPLPITPLLRGENDLNVTRSLRILLYHGKITKRVAADTLRALGRRHLIEDL